MPPVKEIVLVIPEEKFNFLMKTISALTTNIYKWGFDKFFSKKLLTDLRIVKSIIETNKKEDA